jgi:uncharacterized membrane protein
MLVTVDFKPSRINWRVIAAIPLAAAAVHIVATFAAVRNKPASAYGRLKASLPANEMKLLDPVAPGHQPVPYLSADARVGICRFDTTSGPVAVSAVLPDLGWTLGIYKPDGTSAYFAAAAEGRSTAIELKIMPADDRFLGLSEQAKGGPAIADPQLVVTASAGLIVVRAPDKGAPYRSDAEAVLAKARCAAQSY